MKTFDWRACFKKHPVFWDLAEDELASLLDDSLSREIICQPQQVIVSEGDQGDSVFLIGEGEVNVLLKGDGEPSTPIATLGPGELFGEMAVLEGRPRMATVIAGEYAVLLEIDGGPFREFLVKHPEIEFKIAAKLSERLRDLTEHVLTARFKDVDQKLELFNNRLDSELRVIDASMKATQAVFDQTNKRANEIIDSADRSRKGLTTAAMAIGVVITVLGFLGFEKVGKMDHALKVLDDFESKSEQIKSLEQDLKQIDELERELRAKAERINSIEEFQGLSIQSAVDTFEKDLMANNPDARIHYESLMKQNDSDVTNKLFKKVWGGLFGRPIFGLDGSRVRDNYIDLLEYSIGGDYLTPKQRVISYYLMLSGMAMSGDSRYTNYLRSFKNSVRAYAASDESLEEELRTDFDLCTFVAFLEVEASGEQDTDTDDTIHIKKSKLEEIWGVVDQTPVSVPECFQEE